MFILVPNRELVNTLIPFNNYTPIISIVNNNNNINIKINIQRERLVNSSTNISRELLAHSSISSILHVKRMEAQSNNLSWANQVNELNKLQEFYSFYTSPKIGEDNIYNKVTKHANMLNSHGYTNIPNSHGEVVTNP